jgi:hypothetical protein
LTSKSESLEHNEFTLLTRPQETSRTPGSAK